MYSLLCFPFQTYFFFLEDYYIYVCRKNIDLIHSQRDYYVFSKPAFVDKCYYAIMLQQKYYLFSHYEYLIKWQKIAKLIFLCLLLYQIINKMLVTKIEITRIQIKRLKKEHTNGILIF